MPFRDLVGHSRLTSLLSRSIESDRLPASLIFSGPAGVGKHETAIAVAQTLNCFDRRSPAPHLPVDACGRCSPCSRVRRGLHPDVLRLVPEDSRSIKTVAARQAVEHVAYRPFEGRRRVVIIDEADALTTDAQDVLLKSLEEPPAGCLFILVTARPEALLPTVRSRCQRFRFGVLGPAEIVGVLTSRLKKTHEQASAAAAVANGSLGNAVALVDSDLAEVREAACRVLGDGANLKDSRRRLDTIKGLLRKRPAAASVGNDRDDLAVHLRVLASLLRDVALVSSRGQLSLVANADRMDQLESLAESYGGERALGAFVAVDRAIDALERNANPKIVVDWLAFQV
ncbi:MAG: ATP-binding protein [Vicinamibacterales bacterium]